jgi:hypothetical protein
MRTSLLDSGAYCLRKEQVSDPATKMEHQRSLPFVRPSGKLVDKRHTHAACGQYGCREPRPDTHASVVSFSASDFACLTTVTLETPNMLRS